MRNLNMESSLSAKLVTASSKLNLSRQTESSALLQVLNK